MGRMVAGLLALVGLAAGVGPARADCVSECEAATYCDSEMHSSGECARKLNDCYITSCSKPRVSYGAIAYDAETGAVGWSYDFDDAPAAERKALAGCGEHGGNCKVVYDFWNSCAALAATDDGRYSVGRADTQDDAKVDAMAACEQNGSGTCAIQAWSCTGR